MKPEYGEVTRILQVTDAEGDPHLMVQVATESGVPVVGILRASPNGQSGMLRFVASGLTVDEEWEPEHHYENPPKRKYLGRCQPPMHYHGAGDTCDCGAVANVAAEVTEVSTAQRTIGY